MPPRALARPPFAGIGTPASSVGAASPFPSPERPSSRLGSRTTPISFAGSSASSAAAAATQDPIPSPHDAPLALHHLQTPSRTTGIDYSLGTSAVSESLSKAYFYDVVLEADNTSSANVSQDAPGLLLPWLGDVIVDHTGSTESDSISDASMPRSGSGSSINAVSSPQQSRDASSSSSHAKADPARFQGRVQELIDTERSYVRRIDALHQKYALPLRKLAKDRDTAIIPVYEAQRLFGNIGELVGANQAFLNDLENLASHGSDALRSGLGDVVYRHMSCFGCYTEYFANFEKAKHIEQTLAKHRGFHEFTDRVKYSMIGLGNVGLRDLLMEPIQRIPRYKMMLDGIIKYMDVRDPQRGRLEDAIMLASRIASCEADGKTKRAAVLWSFSRNVDSFPAGLISAHREFIDCIDVDDFPLDALGAPAGIFSPGTSIASSSKTLHCTLFLFDDRLAIVKRASASACGRKLVGLDNLNKLADQMKTFTERSTSSSHSSSHGSRKGELGFRGSVSIMDVEALDLGGSDFQLSFLKTPSQVSGDKWSNRPVRQYVTVDTSNALNSSRGAKAFENDTQARLEKTRFLESLWRAKALYKTREHRSHVRCQILPAIRPSTHERRGSRDYEEADDDDDSVQAAVTRESEARRVIYWNVYTRRNYLSEPHKAHLVLHVNHHHENDPIPFGPEMTPPHASLEVISVDDAYGECAVSKVTKVDPETRSEPTVVQIGDLAIHMAELAHETNKLLGGQMTLFTVSQPNPTSGFSGHRAKMAAGLEHLGRSLLGSNAGSDVFGSPARRSKSNASKTTTSSSEAPSVSSRAMTYSTAGTSVSSRNGLLDTFGGRSPDSTLLGSPRRLMRKRRSSSVGPPAMSDHSPGRHYQDRMARTPEPGPGYLSTSLAVADSAEERTPTRSTSPLPFQPRASSRLGGSIAGRARTESTPMRSPMFARGTASVDLERTPGSIMRPSGPREASGHPSSATDDERAPVTVMRATTPLNIRRKPVPSMGAAMSEDESGAENTMAVGVRATPGQQRRTPSGSKRTLPSDSTPTAADKPAKRVSVRDESEEPTEGRPSISESEASSTERGHGAGSVAATAPVPIEAPTPARAASSAGTGRQEVKRRARGVYEAIKRLKVEVGQSGPLQEVDQNQSARLNSLVADVEKWWAASYRQTERVLRERGDTSKLETHVAALERKCELLATLETDGRTENTVLHKAFNEELDRMYEDTQKPEDEQLAILRAQVVQLKEECNDLSVRNKKLARDLELERGQCDVYKKRLEDHGLL